MLTSLVFFKHRVLKISEQQRGDFQKLLIFEIISDDKNKARKIGNKFRNYSATKKITGKFSYPLNSYKFLDQISKRNIFYIYFYLICFLSKVVVSS